jgi:hypothetical protein
MRTKAGQAASAAVRDRTMRRVDRSLRAVAIGMGAAFAMSAAGAAERANADGIVRFTGALVDLYDVTFDAPSSGAVESPAATLRFDAHGRRLPGALVALVGLDGRPLSRDAAAAIRATWRDAHDDRHVRLALDRAHRVGPYGGVMTVAGPAPESETGAAAPVVIRIRHP